MTCFHFAFDLNHFGFIHQDFYRDPLWTVQRTCILSLFLLCAGCGQAIAVHSGQTWGRFWRRWSQVAACAIAVSAGSALMFPNSWIYFGVLHGMAVMALRFPSLDAAGRQARIQWWSAGLLRAVELDTLVDGGAPEVIEPARARFAVCRSPG